MLHSPKHSPKHKYFHDGYPVTGPVKYIILLVLLAGHAIRTGLLLLVQSSVLLSLQLSIDLSALGGFVAMCLGLQTVSYTSQVERSHCDYEHTGSVGFFLDRAVSLSSASSPLCSSAARRLAMERWSSIYGSFRQHTGQEKYQTSKRKWGGRIVLESVAR